MYVCICNGITEKQVRRAAKRGADNVYDLRTQLGVASGCGTCADTAKSILDEENSKRSTPHLYVPSLP